MAKIPLFPFEEGRNFPVGAPFNGRADSPYEQDSDCRDPNRDYSGNDPAIQFPRNWHVKAGYGGMAGGFHQDLTRFEPQRVAVVRDPDKPRNLIRMVGGAPGTPGGAELARWFDRDVWHKDGRGVLAEWTFKPTSEGGAGGMYFNFELRGELNFTAHKNESVECFGIHLMSDRILAAYWLNAHNDSKIDEARQELKTAWTLELDRWYRLTMQLTPTATPDTWDAVVRLKKATQTVYVLHCRGIAAPNNIRRVTQMTFGDEREKNETGGVWLVARAMAWELGEGGQYE